MVEFAISLTPGHDDMWHIAAQMGVTRAVGMFPRPLDTSAYPLWERDVCARVKDLYESRGMELAAIEGRWVGMEHIKLGTSERDSELERVLATIRNFGEVGIPVLCYNWQTYFGARRTSRSLPIRGGALATAYDRDADTPHDFGGVAVVRESELFENYRYFLSRAVPVAEKAGVKLALHPDDPPLPEVAGAPRLFVSVERFQEALELFESDAHGVCFCQANFALMGADIPETIRLFADMGRLHFAHFRDVSGPAENFVESFHDNGQTDMNAAMRAYLEAGFAGVMRPDHAPSMWGESNERPGYEALGKIFAIGYMTGLRESLRASMAS